MTYYHFIIKKYILYTLIIAISLFLLSCNNISQELFAIPVYPTKEEAYIEGSVFTVIKKTRKGLQIQTDKHSITIDLSRAIIFNNYDEALLFSGKFSAYIGTYVTLLEETVVYERPSVDEKRLITLSENSKVKIISPLEQPTSITPSSVFKDIKGYWIRIQDNETAPYTRGWILLTQNTHINFEQNNALNASTLIQSLQHEKQFIDVSDLQNITNDSLSYTPTLLHMEKPISNMPFITVSIEKGNKQIYSFPLSQLWPLSPYTAIIPNQQTIVSWNKNDSSIGISFSDSYKYLFQPFSEQILKEMTQKAIFTRTYIYDKLTRFIPNTSQLFISWYSNLFGTFYTKPIEGTLKIAVKWEMPKEIAKIYFPPNVYTIEGVLSLTHVLANNIESNSDAVLSIFIPSIQETIFLAYTHISDTQFTLEFIPEANILTDTATEFIISAPPTEPKILFEKISP